MKHILITLFLAFNFFNCKAQSPILTLDDLGWRNTDNAYYKDLNNELNIFEGTWLYANINTSLKIKLIKISQHFNGKYYEDRIIGGYQYIENGVEIVNTLADSNNPSLGISASIDGNTIYDNCSYLPIDDCIDGEIRLGLSISDPNSTGHIGDLILHRRVINGQEALKINIEMNYAGEAINGNFPAPTIPWQMHNIILIKQ